MFKKGYKQTTEHKNKIGEANKVSVKRYYDNGGIPWNRGKKYSPEESIKVSRNLGKYAQKAAIPWNKGFTKETDKRVKKISESQKGKSSPLRGIPRSEETKRKIGLANKGRKCSDETRKKMSERLKKNPLNYWLGKKRPDMSGKNHSNWAGGISQEPYGRGWTDILKESIRLRDNYKCQICGISQEEYNSTLIIHHLNGIKTDLNPDNLLALCRSCHTKLHRSPFLKSTKEIELRAVLINQTIQPPTE